MAVFCKIFMKFEKKFWEGDNEILMASDDYGRFPFWKPLSDQIIFAVVTGDEARRIEHLDQLSLSLEIQAHLSSVYKTPMAAPSSIHVCKWHSNPQFHGSYSFIPVGFNKQEDLAKPVGRIHFAGEAYDERYSGYVHGAYRSGQVVAEQIIELMK